MVTSGDGPRPTAEPARPDAAAAIGPAGPPETDETDETDGQARLMTLLATAGAYGRPLRTLVAGLTTPGARAAAPPHPAGRGADAAGRLVRTAGLPRRTVEEVLTALGDDLIDDPAAGPRLRPELVAAYRRLIGADDVAATPAEPLAGPLAAHADLVATMRELIAAAPRPRADLDHVAATAETVVRRALWLAASYDLTGRRLLCVGDHDLTSLAAAAVIPGLRVTVVDVDDELLSFLHLQARVRDLDVQPYFADLRFGLPPAVVASADLAFTDPPYTPEGVALFCARGAEGLGDRERGRVLLAYGFSDRTPTLGWKTQRALSDAGFALEAMLPAFHAYDGAEAVGARADLYVCRPTSHTWRHVDRGTGPLAVDAAIYSRGRASLESAPRQLPEPALRDLVTAAIEAAADADAARAAAPGPGASKPAAAGGGLVFVGEAPPPPGTAGDRPVTHTRLATLLAQGLPPAARAHRPVMVAADLTDDPGGWLPRLLLAANADALAALVRADHPALAAAPRAAAAVTGGEQPRPAHPGTPGGLAPGAPAPKWRPRPPLPAGRGPDGGRLWVLAYAAVDPAQSAGQDRWLRFLLDRAHGRLGNVWREALVGQAREADGGALSKREARAIIESTLPERGRELLQARLLDLPLDAAADLLDAARRSWRPRRTEPDLAAGRRA